MIIPSRTVTEKKKSTVATAEEGEPVVVAGWWGEMTELRVAKRTREGGGVEGCFEQARAWIGGGEGGRRRRWREGGETRCWWWGRRRRRWKWRKRRRWRRC